MEKIVGQMEKTDNINKGKRQVKGEEVIYD